MQPLCFCQHHTPVLPHTGQQQRTRDSCHASQRTQLLLLLLLLLLLNILPPAAAAAAVRTFNPHSAELRFGNQHKQHLLTVSAAAAAYPNPNTTTRASTSSSR
jgi:hypothetical protein